jgi:hypothetical protein
MMMSLTNCVLCFVPMVCTTASFRDKNHATNQQDATQQEIQQEKKKD